MDDDRETGFEFAPIGLVVARHRMIEECNRRLCEIFRYSRLNLLGSSLSRLYPSTDEFTRTGAIGLARMRDAGYYSDERIMMRRGGGHFWCRVRGQSLTPDDPFAQVIWSFTDLSEARPISKLTRRERQVAMLLADGSTSKEIAALLSISPRTVEAHRAKLLKRFKARNTAELLARLSGIPS